MASNVRQNRTLEAYCCLRGLENEVTSDFCLAPSLHTYKNLGQDKRINSVTVLKYCDRE